MVDLIESIICYECPTKQMCHKTNLEQKWTCWDESDKEDVHGGLKEWLSSFDTNSATECFTAVNLLKQRLEGEDGRT